MRAIDLRIAAPIVLVALASVAFAGLASSGKAVWNPDRGDGVYRNPVLFADYSDPDVIRDGDDFYLVASSFASVPGLPILHSRDLVNWTIVGHAAPRLPSPEFDAPQHGKGLWAPSLRKHGGRFWIYVGDPDRGIYVTTASDPRGPWTPLALVKEAKGAIDPCPLWDDDGRMYLVHAWAKSRAGFNSVLTVTPLSADGSRAAGRDVQVFDGRANHPTIEGPKFYKRNGWYYIFAPAGGVATGWQTVLRAKTVWGPYEDRIVMREGGSGVNGPHQGAWIETRSSESWFMHFQDRGVYGRVVHLQPLLWRNDWPVIGADPDGDGVGEPVATFRKPVAEGPAAVPQTSDEFDALSIGLQWQWNANPSSDWASLSARPGWLRLAAVSRPASTRSIFNAGAVLLQKVPAEEFTASASIDAAGLAEGQRVGLVVMGRDTAFIGLRRTAQGLRIVRSTGRNVDGDGADEESADEPEGKGGLPSSRAILRARFDKAGRVRLDLRLAGAPSWSPATEFVARPGVWVGARFGLFASAPAASGDKVGAHGYAEVDWFRVEPLEKGQSQ
ncbi:MAG: glycoside hydrolase 43 family protein [Vicinamibacteria bacterium]|nr:glycoside hydrolase 43 family protein [Vicinamibacteria bacterium]